MKKLFTILIVLFIAMGSNFVFAQENDITSVDKATSVLDENTASVAKEVGGGEIADNPKDSQKKVQFDPKEKTPFEEFNKSVGLFVYAYPGLSWQQWFGGFGYQINFSGMYLPSEYVDYNDASNLVSYDYIEAFCLLTAEAQFEFFTVKFLDDLHGRLYGVILGGLYYSSDYSKPGVLNGVSGIGIGYETVYRKHLSMPIHIGYYAEYPTDFKMDFMGGIGFRFRF